MKGLLGRKNEVIAELRNGIAQSMKKNKVTVIQGHAALVNNKTIGLRRVTAQLLTKSKPKTPSSLRVPFLLFRLSRVRTPRAYTQAMSCSKMTKS